MRERLKRLYEAGKISVAGVLKAETLGWIIHEDVIYILGYDPTPEPGPETEEEQ